MPNASVCKVANSGLLQIWRGVHVCGGGLGDVPRVFVLIYEAMCNYKGVVGFTMQGNVWA